MFRMLLHSAFRWIVALGTLAGSGALIGTVPLFQEATPALELELADVETPAEELQPEMIIEPEDVGMSGLHFHPEVMYRGDDECQETYVVRGSLKNHGPDVLDYVEITYTVPSSVTVTLFPTDTTSLEANKPLRFTAIVSISDMEAWEAGDPESVTIPLTATGKIADNVVSTAKASVHIYNACLSQEDEDSDNGDEDNDDDGNEMGIAGLVFHPGPRNSGGVCRTTYTAQGSLKNHDSAPVTGVEIISTTVTWNGDDVSDLVTVTIDYDTNYELTPSKPLRFTVNVSPNKEWWESLGKGQTIEVTIAALVSGETDPAAMATMTVRNQCKEAKEKNNPKADDLGTKGKPDKPEHPQGGPPGQQDKEKPEHPQGGPPGQQDKNKDKNK